MFSKILRLFFTNKSRCKCCDFRLDECGYCSRCIRFPYKRWITEAEDLFLSDELFRRDNPDGYALMERNHCKISVFYGLTNNRHDRDFYAKCFGEELVAEVESDITNGLKEPTLDQ